LQTRDGTICVAGARCHPGEDLDRKWTFQTVFFDGDGSLGSLGERQRCHLVTETAVGHREVANQNKVFRLFFQ
jgi:hypothetical protein